MALAKAIAKGNLKREVCGRKIYLPDMERAWGVVGRVEGGGHELWSQEEIRSNYSLATLAL